MLTDYSSLLEILIHSYCTHQAEKINSHLLDKGFNRRLGKHFLKEADDHLKRTVFVSFVIDHNNKSQKAGYMFFFYFSIFSPVFKIRIIFSPMLSVLTNRLTLFLVK